MRKKLKLIYANDGVSLIPMAGDAGQAKVVNPHTFISTTAAIQQVYHDRARAWRARPSRTPRSTATMRARMRCEIRKLQGRVRRADRRRRPREVPLRHDARGLRLLLQEFGLQVTAVIEPRHGVEPTARQLAETIDRIKAANVNVLFAEKYFASKLADTIKRGHRRADVLLLAHQSDGDYTPELSSDEMRENLRRSSRQCNDVSKKARVDL